MLKNKKILESIVRLERIEFMLDRFIMDLKFILFIILIKILICIIFLIWIIYMLK